MTYAQGMLWPTPARDSHLCNTVYPWHRQQGLSVLYSDQWESKQETQIARPLDQSPSPRSQSMLQDVSHPGRRWSQRWPTLAGHPPPLFGPQTGGSWGLLGTRELFRRCISQGVHAFIFSNCQKIDSGEHTFWGFLDPIFFLAVCGLFFSMWG